MWTERPDFSAALHEVWATMQRVEEPRVTQEDRDMAAKIYPNQKRPDADIERLIGLGHLKWKINRVTKWVNRVKSPRNRNLSSYSRSSRRTIWTSRLCDKRNGGANLPEQSSNESDNLEQDPQVKVEFIEAWGPEEE